MKRVIGLTAIALATLSGCGSYSQSDQSLWHETPNYSAMKSARPPAKAYAYGEGTVLEFPEGGSPAWIRIKDAAGLNVPFEQVGRFIRIPKSLERLTAWVNGVPHEFMVIGGAQSIALVPVTAPVSAAMLATPGAEVPTTQLEPVKLERASSATVGELRDELEKVKATIRRLSDRKDASASDWHPITQRLDALETRIAEVAAATIAVQFSHGATTFRPSPEASRLIAVAIKSADSINIKGYTDARVAGPADPRIALGRAMSAKGYLIGEGVSPSRIVVSSQADGGFVADNTTVEGRARNRRVEIEFVPRTNAG